jgi:hypothetical protein
VLEGLEIGSTQEIPGEPCKVSKKARELSEIMLHCYVHTTKFVGLARY